MTAVVPAEAAPPALDPEVDLELPSGSWELPRLPALVYESLVRRALEEDLGRAGDLTSDATLPGDLRAEARLVARQDGSLAGLDVAALAFRLLDPALDFRLEAHDGQDVVPGDLLAVIQGPARSLLAAERTALNFLGHLSGIATETRRIARQLEGTSARVVCTRKTTPGLRALEKYAVRAGGGSNHRFGLDDAVLIKDNHIALAGGPAAAIRRARAHVGHMVKIEIEVDTLGQLDEVLPLGPDAVLLDNMSPETLAQAVAKVRACPHPILTEASGGITPDTAAAIAATGVDMLSVGWITHSAPSLDVALDIGATSPRS